MNNRTITTVYLIVDFFLLQLILLKFKIFGFAPFNVNIIMATTTTMKRMTLNFSYSWTGAAYNIILICCTPFFIYYLEDKIYDNKISTVAGLLKIIVHCGCVVAAAIIFLFYLINQRNIIAVANRFMDLDLKLINKSSNWCHQHCQKYHFILIFLIHMSSCIILITTQTMQPEKKNSTVAIIPGYFLATCMIQYSFVLMHLQKIFNSLNKSLVLLANTSNNPTTLEDIRFIRRMQRNFYEVKCEITDIYAWPTILCGACSCIGTIYSSYHFILTFMETSEHTFSTINAGFWILHAVLPIIILIVTISNLVDEVCLFNY